MADNLNADVARLLDKVLASLTAPAPIEEWIEKLEAVAVSEGRLGTAYDMAHTPGNAMPRYKVRARVMLNDWAKKGIVEKISRGVYGPVSTRDDLEEDEPLDEDGEVLETGGYIYAFGFPSLPGKMKIGKAVDWKKRMLQHARNYSNAGAPELPELLAVWKVPQHHATEDAIHALLKLRDLHYDRGAGKEWFTCTREELERLLVLAIGRKPFSKVELSSSEK